ncbi:uncharacterized protein RJT20DRAFT_123782 [Scheffersomyces xylosifermentans]|uniref:uncharacterized protein n=1 Tax=Scheffersomyces xylosifermentans TaxID=1304137 RepID=UPI00315D070E
MSTQDDCSVSASATATDNPLLQKLGADQFRASVRFYEADQKLTPEDRKTISDDLQSILLRTNFYGYGSSILGFAMPTLYYKLKGVKPPQVVAPGFRPYTPLVQKPFLSFMVGLTALLITNQQVCKYQFQQKLNSFQDRYTESNQVDVWKAMDFHQAGLFYLYYLRTSTDPSFIIKDPRTFTRQQQHEVHVIPPSQRSSHFSDALGLGHKKHSDNGQIQGEGLSHWDRIRIANGFDISEAPKEDAAPSIKAPEASDSFVEDDINELDKNVESNSNAPKSAWDSIRKGTK